MLMWKCPLVMPASSTIQSLWPLHRSIMRWRQTQSELQIMSTNRYHQNCIRIVHCPSRPSRSPYGWHNRISQGKHFIEILSNSNRSSTFKLKTIVWRTDSVNGLDVSPGQIRLSMNPRKRCQMKEFSRVTGWSFVEVILTQLSQIGQLSLQCSWCASGTLLSLTNRSAHKTKP